MVSLDNPWSVKTMLVHKLQMTERDIKISTCPRSDLQGLDQFSNIILVHNQQTATFFQIDPFQPLETVETNRREHGEFIDVCWNLSGISVVLCTQFGYGYHVGIDAGRQKMVRMERVVKLPVVKERYFCRAINGRDCVLVSQNTCMVIRSFWKTLGLESSVIDHCWNVVPVKEFSEPSQVVELAYLETNRLTGRCKNGKFFSVSFQVDENRVETCVSNLCRAEIRDVVLVLSKVLIVARSRSLSAYRMMDGKKELMHEHHLDETLESMSGTGLYLESCGLVCIVGESGRLFFFSAFGIYLYNVANRGNIKRVSWISSLQRLVLVELVGEELVLKQHNVGQYFDTAQGFAMSGNHIFQCADSGIEAPPRGLTVPNYHWSILPGVEQYVLQNGPIRHVWQHGKIVVLAGQYDFVVFDRMWKRTRMYGKKFSVSTSKVLFLGKGRILVPVVGYERVGYIDTSTIPEYEIRIFSLDHGNWVVARMGTQVLILDWIEQSRIFFTYSTDNCVRIHKLVDQEELESVAMFRLDDLFKNPRQIHQMEWVGWRRWMLVLSIGELLLVDLEYLLGIRLEPELQGCRLFQWIRVDCDQRAVIIVFGIFADAVMTWTIELNHLEPNKENTNRIRSYLHKGFLDPVQISMQKSIPLYFDKNNGTIYGIELGPCRTMIGSVKTHLAIPHLVGAYIRRDEMRLGFELCQLYITKPYFQHMLEMVLMQAVEQGNMCCGFSDDCVMDHGTVLLKTARFLSRFEGFLGLVIRVIRKVECSGWDRLFVCMGLSPLEMLKESIDRKDYRTALLYCITLDFSEEHVPLLNHLARLLIEDEDFESLESLVRFGGNITRAFGNATFSEELETDLRECLFKWQKCKDYLLIYKLSRICPSTVIKWIQQTPLMLEDSKKVFGELHDQFQWPYPDEHTALMLQKFQRQRNGQTPVNDGAGSEEMLEQYSYDQDLWNIFVNVADFGELLQGHGWTMLELLLSTMLLDSVNVLVITNKYPELVPEYIEVLGTTPCHGYLKIQELLRTHESDHSP